MSSSRQRSSTRCSSAGRSRSGSTGPNGMAGKRTRWPTGPLRPPERLTFRGPLPYPPAFFVRGSGRDDAQSDVTVEQVHQPAAPRRIHQEGICDEHCGPVHRPSAAKKAPAKKAGAKQVGRQASAKKAAAPKKATAKKAPAKKAAEAAPKKAARPRRPRRRPLRPRRPPRRRRPRRPRPRRRSPARSTPSSSTRSSSSARRGAAPAHPRRRHASRPRPFAWPRAATRATSSSTRSRARATRSRSSGSATSPCRPSSGGRSRRSTGRWLKIDDGHLRHLRGLRHGHPQGAPEGDPVGPRAGRVQGRRLRPSLSSRTSSRWRTPRRRSRCAGRVRVPARPTGCCSSLLALGWLAARPAHQVLGRRHLTDGNIDVVWTACASTSPTTPARRSAWAAATGRWIALVAVVIVALLVWQGLQRHQPAGRDRHRPHRRRRARQRDRPGVPHGRGGFLGGSVVDFIDLQWWPVFNVADVGVVVGRILLVVASFLPDRDDDRWLRGRPTGTAAEA